MAPAELADFPAAKRSRGLSPAARCLAFCRAQGWTAQVVEHRVPAPGVFVTRDLFGCIDIVACLPDGILGIQACAATDHARRRAKALAEPRLRAWAAAGGRFEVWSWGKRGDRGKAKRWTLRRDAVDLLL